MILASGSGSNAEAIIRSATTYRVSTVICDNPQALVLERVKKLNISAHVVEKNLDESKFEYNQRLVDSVKSYNPDWIVLAGFMKMLSKEFLQNFYDERIKQCRIINIHPSLLPWFPGKDAYEQAFEANVSEYGCTIHFVDEGMDTGKIIYQQRLQREAQDTFEIFKARGLELENKIYPLVLEKLIEAADAEDAKLDFAEVIK